MANKLFNMCYEAGVHYTRDVSEAGADYTKLEYTAKFTSPGAEPVTFRRYPVYVLGGESAARRLIAYWTRTAYSGGALSGWSYEIVSLEKVGEKPEALRS